MKTQLKKWASAAREWMNGEDDSEVFARPMVFESLESRIVYDASGGPAPDHAAAHDPGPGQPHGGDAMDPNNCTSSHQCHERADRCMEIFIEEDQQFPICLELQAKGDLLHDQDVTRKAIWNLKVGTPGTSLNHYINLGAACSNEYGLDDPRCQEFFDIADKMAEIKTGFEPMDLSHFGWPDDNPAGGSHGHHTTKGGQSLNTDSIPGDPRDDSSGPEHQHDHSGSLNGHTFASNDYGQGSSHDSFSGSGFGGDESSGYSSETHSGGTDKAYTTGSEQDSSSDHESGNQDTDQQHEQSQQNEESNDETKSSDTPRQDDNDNEGGDNTDTDDDYHPDDTDASITRSSHRVDPVFTGIEHGHKEFAPRMGSGDPADPGLQDDGHGVQPIEDRIHMGDPADPGLQDGGHGYTDFIPGLNMGDPAGPGVDADAGSGVYTITPNPNPVASGTDHGGYSGDLDSEGGFGSLGSHSGGMDPKGKAALLAGIERQHADFALGVGTSDADDLLLQADEDRMGGNGGDLSPSNHHHP